MASRLRFARAQLLPGSRAALAALATLLDADDLSDAVVPGRQWQRLDQRTWRTGAVADPRPWQSAARAAGSVTAWRSLADVRQASWLWVQWSPLATPAGAAEALAAADDPALALRNRRATVESVRRRGLAPPPVVDGADGVTATEEQTTGPDPVRTLRCTAGRHLVLLCASGAGWTRPALVTLAERQLSRLPPRG